MVPNRKSNLKFIILLYSYAQVVAGLNLIELDDKLSTGVSKSLNKRNIDIQEIFDDDHNPDDEETKVNLKKNKVLVKRLVPHDQPSKLEYIDEHRAFYKPLVRIHSAKNIPEKEDEFKTVQKVLNNDKFKKVTINNNVKSKIRLLKSLLEIANRGSFPDRSDLIGLVKGLTGEVVLRENHFEKSGEESNEDKSGETPQKHKKLWLPFYSIWNGWTFHNSIFHDECPQNQIKVNNLCIWTPPH